MTRTKRRYLLKGLVLSNPSLEVKAKVSSLNKNQKTHHKHKRIHIIMKILTIIIITRIIRANPEVTDPMEDKIQDISLEVKIFVVEVKEIRIHTKVNTKTMAIKATITKVIEDSIILQYYVHDDEYQMDQYGPPCTLCGGYNHSLKHCFKGEHDINDIMEKMNINDHQSQSSGLYS